MITAADYLFLNYLFLWSNSQRNDFQSRNIQIFIMALISFLSVSADKEEEMMIGADAGF